LLRFKTKTQYEVEREKVKYCSRILHDFIAELLLLLLTALYHPNPLVSLRRRGTIDTLHPPRTFVE